MPKLKPRLSPSSGMTTNPSDSGSFDEIFQRHEDYLRGRARKLTGAEADAKDLVHDTYVRGRNYFERFKQGTNGRSWLTRIMSCLFLDKLKHKRVIANAAPQLATLFPSVDCLDISSVSNERMEEAARGLEPAQCRLIVLRYIHGMKHREIAAALNMPLGTVANQLARALKRLRELLDR